MRETTTAHGWDRVWDNWHEAQRCGTLDGSMRDDVPTDGQRQDVAREATGRERWRDPSGAYAQRFHIAPPPGYRLIGFAYFP